SALVDIDPQQRARGRTIIRRNRQLFVKYNTIFVRQAIEYDRSRTGTPASMVGGQQITSLGNHVAALFIARQEQRLADRAQKLALDKLRGILIEAANPLETHAPPAFLASRYVYF